MPTAPDAKICTQLAEQQLESLVGLFKVFPQSQDGFEQNQAALECVAVGPSV